MGREQATAEPRYRVVIDCDPGVDDALALLAALAAPVFQLDFISTVAGNAPVDRTTANALAVIALTGRTDVPVYIGAEHPLVRQLDGGDDQPDPLFSATGSPLRIGSAAGPAHKALRAWLRQPSGLPKRLIAIGPLTNIAVIVQQDPGALHDLDALFVMGGSLSRHGGRFSPIAETNFFLDPESAAIVMGSGAPIRLFDYDATSRCAVTDAAAARITSAAGAVFASRIGGWLHALYEAQVVRQGRTSWAIHDLCAIAGAAGIDPGHWETVRLQVETASANRGAVIAQFVDQADPGAVHVARDLDVEATLRFLTSWLWRLPAASQRT